MNIFGITQTFFNAACVFLLYLLHGGKLYYKFHRIP